MKIIGIVVAGIAVLMAVILVSRCSGDVATTSKPVDSHSDVSPPPPADAATRETHGSVAVPPEPQTTREPPPESDLEVTQSPASTAVLQPLERYYEPSVGREELEKLFDAEPVDSRWAPSTSSSIDLLLASMPERAVMQAVDVTCKATLCAIEIKGDASILAAPTAANNVQSALMREFAQPAMLREFDDQILFVTFEPGTSMATIRMIVHRRKQGG